MDELEEVDAPETLEALFARLAGRVGTMPKRLRQCADYIVQNPDRVAVSTVAELAAAAEVQPSAVMRFCQELGFRGFSQMQRLFREDYSRKWPDYSTRLQSLRESGESRPEVLLAEFVEAGRSSLEKLMTTVDADALERAVAVLAGASVIHIVGYRRSYPIAAYLAYAFEKMAVPCVLHSGVGRLATSHSVRPGDAVLSISFAPYSVETVEFVAEARGAGHPVVAITDSLSSQLQRHEVTPLLVSEVDVGSFRALSGSFALAISLAVAVGARRDG